MDAYKCVSCTTHKSTETRLKSENGYTGASEWIAALDSSTAQSYIDHAQKYEGVFRQADAFAGEIEDDDKIELSEDDEIELSENEVA